MMKIKTHFRLTALLVFVLAFVLPLTAAFVFAGPAYAAASVQETAPVDVSGEQILESILYVAGIFALLPGIALLTSSLTNGLKAIGKLVGFSFDDKSDKITAWLNLAAFLLLVGFRVFSPDVTFEWLDGQAKLIADSLIALSFFFGQLKLQPFAYSALKGKLPFVGTSYSKASQ